MTEDMTIIAEEAYLAAKEILEKARLEQGELFVVGCSTSEVGGATIGTYSSPAPSWVPRSSPCPTPTAMSTTPTASIWLTSRI